MSTFTVPTGDPQARPRRSRRRSLYSSGLIALTAVVVATLTPLSGAAERADAAPQPATASPETVTADVLPTPQINGVAWDQLVVGDTVYVGGNFSSARPFGAKAGTNEQARSNLLAYDLHSGELLPYAPTFDAQIRTLAVSPDGKRLYAGGYFQKVNGQPRYRIAAFDLPSGNLVAGFQPYANAAVNAMVATDSALYFGGSMTTVAKAAGTTAVARAKAAAVAAVDGSVLPWAPRVTNGWVNAMIASPDASKIVLGGTFRSLNGSITPGYTMGAVDTVQGTAVLPWIINKTIPWRHEDYLYVDQSVYSLASDGEFVYGTAGPGLFEGTFKARWSDGSREGGWVADCYGDTYSVVPVGDVVYTASHAHNCVGVGGFGDYVAPDKWYRALAFTTAPTHVTDRQTSGFPGSSPTLLDWFPSFDIGKTTGQGPWDVTAAQGFVLYGGEFSTVNKTGQQGLARFGTREQAPNKQGPLLEGDAMKPKVTSWGSSYAKITWTSNYDRDDALLTYQVIRDGNTAKPVFQTTAESRFWKRSAMSAVDGHLNPGQTYNYRLRIIDAAGNVKWSTTTSHTTPASSTWGQNYISGYDRKVLEDRPVSYWSMNEPSGIAYDWGRVNDHLGALSSPRVAGIEGTPGSSAANFPVGGGYAPATRNHAAPKVFTSEAWIRTTSSAGGQIIGFNATQNPRGNARDRFVYMLPDGRIGYWVSPNGTGNDIYSTERYNDGSWHHVAASLSGAGMQLYVDGRLVSSKPSVTSGYVYTNGGYWQVGGLGTDSLFAGAIDNVAVYDRALTADEISAHVTAVNPPKPNAAPSASFRETVSDLALSVDAAASTDPDGTIASYAWSFGDGTTATGRTTSHEYPTAGTYTVKLTVTDDKGGTASVSKPVTVAADGVLAEDAFARSTTNGWGAASRGGTWKLSGGATGFSTGGEFGRIVDVPGQSRAAVLPTVSSTATDSRVSFALDSVPTGGGQFVSLIGRQVGAESYSARVWVQSSGVLQVQVMRSGTVIRAVNLTGVAYTAGDVVNLRLNVTGSGTTAVSAKAWVGNEPSGWQLTATDTTAALQGQGSVGLGLYVSSSAAAAATTVSFSGFRVVTSG